MSVAGAQSRFVVGIDGSFASRVAVERAATLARRVSGEVVATHVMSKMSAWLSSLPDESFRRTDEQLNELLRGLWTEPLRQCGVPYRTALLAGDPAASLLRIARDERALCIVVGRTGLSGDTAGVTGGTALKLTDQDRVPVLVLSAQDTVPTITVPAGT